MIPLSPWQWLRLWWSSTLCRALGHRLVLGYGPAYCDRCGVELREAAMSSTEIPLHCPRCEDALVVPKVGESLRCSCGTFEVIRGSADSYSVRAPMGEVGRALERACWLATPGPADRLSVGAPEPKPAPEKGFAARLLRRALAGVHA